MIEYKAHLIWALAIVLVVAIVIAGGLVAGGYDHNFDTTCINKGKSIVYVTVPGDSYAQKECK